MTIRTVVVTLLFTDLVGSTEFAQWLGEDRAKEVRRQHMALLRDAIWASGGREIKHLGDGLMVVFEAPSAAAACAVAMQVAVDRHNRELEYPLGLRVGLHTDEVAREDEDYFGTAVVVAQRLCKHCGGGQIFASDVVRMLVGARGGLLFKEIGPVELKGMSEPVTTYELHWEPAPSTDDLQQGRAALERRTWPAAREHLSAADRKEPLGAEDLDRLALAAYMLGHDDEAAEAWTRAQRAWTGVDPTRAARCALWHGCCLLFKGDMAPALGWVARGARVLEECGEDCAEQGLLLVLTGLETLFGGDPSAAVPSFEQASKIAQRFGDVDVLTFARLALGQARVMRGEAREGIALFDEVMAAVTAEEVYPVVAGIAYCQVIDTCQRLFDLRRAREWTAALTRWCDAQPGLVPFRGNCLVHRCEIMQLQGAWPDALDAAQRACNMLSGWDSFGAALYQLGELHRLRGEFDEAEEAYRRASQAGRQPEPGMALLRLAQGRVDAAAAAIRRVMHEAEDPFMRSTALPPYIEVMLASGDRAAARRAAHELAQTAANVGAPYLQAVAAHADGAVLLADGDARSALPRLRSAWVAWLEIDAPREAARARVLIGVACRQLGDEDAANMEFAAAQAVFEELGAGPDLEALRRAREPTPVGKAAGGLTKREVEILALVASGKTNKAIASELVLSEKTVIRHVSNIFAKLGVSSRAAATAYAYEHGLV
jgi:class 3 adenylate cyclase/DNA-binding CsgD family transcriptional regulator/HPt (histidine-containing phosphotransfer) domain-containing protein